MEKEIKNLKVILTKVGTAYEPTKEYRLFDYIVIDNVTLYTCKRVDKQTMVCVGHPLTDTDYWDKSIDLSDALAKATEATTAATTATEKATEATSAAVTATTNANNATRNTNAAIGNAKKATDAAIEATKNTNIATANVTKAITEATTAAENANAVTLVSKKQVVIAEEMNTHPQKQGDNGNWWRWDSEQQAYVDTGIIARGGLLYPTFKHVGNKLYMVDYGSNTSSRVVKKGNKLIFKL